MSFFHRNHSRLWVWWHARRDRRNNLPSPEATAPGDTEGHLLTGVNLTIRDVERAHYLKAELLKARLHQLQEALEGTYAPEYRMLQEKTGRKDVRIYIPRFLHFVLLILLIAGEVGFNLVAFNILREPGLYTALMALTVSVAIPIGAWFVGVKVRQWPAPWWRTAIEVLVATSILIAVVVGINRIRISYLGALAPEFTEGHPQLQSAFLMINLVILLAAALVTYLAHDPEAGFAEAKRKFESCNSQIARISGRLQQLEQSLRTRVEMLKETGWQWLAYYRMVNRRGRAKVPRYFDDDADKNHRPAFATVNGGQVPERTVSPGKQETCLAQ